MCLKSIASASLRVINDSNKQSWDKYTELKDNIVRGINVLLSTNFQILGKKIQTVIKVKKTLKVPLTVQGFLPAEDTVRTSTQLQHCFLVWELTYTMAAGITHSRDPSTSYTSGLWDSCNIRWDSPHLSRTHKHILRLTACKSMAVLFEQKRFHTISSLYHNMITSTALTEDLTSQSRKLNFFLVLS